MANYKQAETKKVKRSVLNFASYNPRKISDKAKKALRDNIERVGLLGGIVWNKRTGNLVSGHQRVTILDEINGYDGKGNDYFINVEVVDLSEKEEKEQNLFMNNKNVQGEFDEETLKTIMNDIDFSNAGFDDFDISSLCIGDTQMTGITTNFSEVTKTDSGKKVDKKNQEKPKKKEESASTSKFYNDKKDDVLSCLVLSFDSQEEKVKFLCEYGFDANANIIDIKDFIDKRKQNESKES